MYTEMDFTGTSSEYRVINHAFKFIQDNQILEFNDSVYADSIHLYIVGTNSVPLIREDDWIITPSDIDVSATQKAKLLRSDFDKLIVKSITMRKPFTTELVLNCSYQKLNAVPTAVTLKNAKTRLEFTPEVLLDILNRLDVHDHLLGSIQGSVAESTANPIFLELDIHKTIPQNFITNESYKIDTLNGKNIIRPVNTPFFKDSLQVYKPVLGGDPELLVEGTDYHVFGCDYDSTALTSNKGGTYRYILFTQELNTTLNINYHALGGDATLYDIQQVDTAITDLQSFIAGSQLVTVETLDSNPTIKNLLAKVAELESDMRKLSTEGKPSYGDVSSGGSLLKKVIAADTSLHWWTIAELYKVDGSDTIHTSGMAAFNISTLYSKLTFSTTVNVNINNPTEKLNVAVTSSMMPLSYVPFQNYDNIEQTVRPQFRIIWNENSVEGSGILLQLGLQLKTSSEETIVIDDISGPESCWKLTQYVAEAVGPEDDILTLPSKNHVWGLLNADSRQKHYLIPLLDGNVCWVGEEPLNRPTGGFKQIVLKHFLEKEVDISNIRKIRYDLEEDGGNRFPVYLDFLPGTENLLGTNSFMYNGSPVYLNGLVSRELDGNIKMSIGVDVSSGLSSNALNLRHVIVYT